MKVRTLVLSVCVLELFLKASVSRGQQPETVGGAEQQQTDEDACIMHSDRFTDIVILPGSRISKLQGDPISRMRLLVRRRGQWHPVPFQIDEKTEEGDYLFPLGKENDRDRKNRKLDAWDEVLFMARDAGCRADPRDWPPGRVHGEEIEVTDPVTDEQGWFYLFSYTDPPPLSPVDLIRYDPEYDRFLSKYYVAGYSRIKNDQKAVMEYYTVPEKTGGEGVNWFDSAKIWTRIQLFFSILKITIHSDDWVSWVPAYIDGPIRVVVKKRMAIKLGLGLRSPNVDADLIYYPHFFASALVISIPFDPSILTSSMRITIGTDLNHNAVGMLFWNSENPEPVVVDGRMSPQEKALDMKPDRWRVVTGDPGTYLGKAVYAGNFKLSNIKLGEGRYIDDYTHEEPPENEPGIFGSYNWTWDITNGKRGKYVVWMEAHYGPSIETEEDMARCLRVTDHPLHVRVGTRTMLNCLLIPPPGFGRDVLPEMYRREVQEKHSEK